MGNQKQISMNKKKQVNKMVWLTMVMATHELYYMIKDDLNQHEKMVGNKVDTQLRRVLDSFDKLVGDDRLVDTFVSQHSSLAENQIEALLEYMDDEEDVKEKKSSK